MKVLNSLRTAKERHPDCQIVKRKGRLYVICKSGNDSNLLIVFYVQIMPDDFVMQLHRF